MRSSTLTGVVLIAVAAAGCGWNPPSGSPPTSTTACAADTGPGADVVAAEIAKIPAPAGGGQWHESGRGQTTSCQLNWVQVASDSAAPDSPGQVLFFDRATPVGTPTPDPRPYLTVTTSGPNTVTVQYQWKQGDDRPCCPTGIGTARFELTGGALRALDPIPGP
jgi:hypothetical protein